MTSWSLPPWSCKRVSNALRTMRCRWLSLGECVAEHRKAAHRFGFGCLVLQNVPMLFEKAVFEPDNVGRDPGRGPAHPSKAAMRYDVITFCDDELVLIVQRLRHRADEIEQPFATWRYVCTVLNVVR